MQYYRGDSVALRTVELYFGLSIQIHKSRIIYFRRKDGACNVSEYFKNMSI